jgi:hypothetical protein
MFIARYSSLGGAAALLVALCGCGRSDEAEIQAETAAVLEHAPVGTPFLEVPEALREQGFSCTPERRDVADAHGAVRGTESHLSCIREERLWLVCKKRARAVFTHANGKVNHVLVNVGRFCS